MRAPLLRASAPPFGFAAGMGVEWVWFSERRGSEFFAFLMEASETLLRDAQQLAGCGGRTGAERWRSCMGTRSLGGLMD